jgi:hypothetical protein
MALTGYIKVPDSATVGGAPIDAFQADAFRQNDARFEEYLRSIIYTPMLRNAGSGALTHNPGALNPPAVINFTAANKIIFAEEVVIAAALDLNEGWPLVVFATKKITVNAKINGKSKGVEGQVGHLGGAGGGGTSTGSPTVMPVSGQILLPAAAASAAGADLLLDEWIQYMLPVICTVRGGAAGGDAGATKGGQGGGVVILAAPVIEFTIPNAIDVSGEDGTAGAGGGGGGAVVLIRKTLIKPPANPILFAPPFAAAHIINVNGGAAAAGGGKGGNGRVFQIQVP